MHFRAFDEIGDHGLGPCDLALEDEKVVVERATFRVGLDTGAIQLLDNWPKKPSRGTWARMPVAVHPSGSLGESG